MKNANKNILQNEDKYKIKFVFDNNSDVDINEVMKRSFEMSLENQKNKLITRQC